VAKGLARKLLARGTRRTRRLAAEAWGGADEIYKRPEHAKAVDELKALLVAQGVELPKGCVTVTLEATLYRFLVAANFNARAAARKLKKMVEWRRDHDIDRILFHELPEHKLKVLYSHVPNTHHGHDRKGHPVHLEQPGRVNWGEVLKERGTKTITKQDLVHMHIFLMEYQNRILFRKASVKQGYIVDKMTNVLDLKSLNLSILGNLKVIGLFKTIQKIDQDFYPDQIHATYIVNAPIVFNLIWKVLRTCFSNREQEKLHILPSGRRGHRRLAEVLDDESTPKYLGGNCQCGNFCVSGPAGCGDQKTVHHRYVRKPAQGARGNASIRRPPGACLFADVADARPGARAQEDGGGHQAVAPERAASGGPGGGGRGVEVQLPRRVRPQGREGVGGGPGGGGGGRGRAPPGRLDRGRAGGRAGHLGVLERTGAAAVQVRVVPRPPGARPPAVRRVHQPGGGRVRGPGGGGGGWGRRRRGEEGGRAGVRV